MGNIFSDITTAVKLTAEVRRARKEGAAVEVRKTWTIPVIKTGYWGWTMESCLFYREGWKSIAAVFNTFPEEVQHALTFAPKRGEWMNRVRFWQEQLRPALPPKQYHDAMIILTHWGCHCIRRRLGVEA